MTGLRVSLPGLTVGALNRNRHGLTTWTPQTEWERLGQHPRLGVAFLRKPGTRVEGTGLPAWFENLLPEADSALRQRLCAAHGVKERDAFNLLRAIGRDLSGAVEVHANEMTDAAPSEQQTLDAHKPDFPSPEALRFSLAGMQLKLSMSMASERLVLPATGSAGQWIVKLPGHGYPELPDVERWTMS